MRQILHDLIHELKEAKAEMEKLSQDYMSLKKSLIKMELSIDELVRDEAKNDN